jgi:hypothetical protein
MNLTDPSTLCLFLLAVIVVVLMFRTRVRVAAASDASKAKLPSEHEASSAERDLAKWEVQMHETARELSAQIDAKLSLLQSLTAEADRAAQRLEELLDRMPPLQPPAGDIEASPHELDRIVNEQPSTEVAISSDRSRRREEIYQLADYGFAPAEIARRIGSPVGEVELILSLRQN